MGLGVEAAEFTSDLGVEVAEFVTGLGVEAAEFISLGVEVVDILGVEAPDWVDRESNPGPPEGILGVDTAEFVLGVEAAEFVLGVEAAEFVLGVEVAEFVLDNWAGIPGEAAALLE